MPSAATRQDRGLVLVRLPVPIETREVLVLDSVMGQPAKGLVGLRILRIQRQVVGLPHCQRSRELRPPEALKSSSLRLGIACSNTELTARPFPPAHSLSFRPSHLVGSRRTLQARLTAEDGAPLAEQFAQIVYHGQPSRTTKTDPSGVMRIGNYHPGVEIFFRTLDVEGQPYRASEVQVVEPQYEDDDFGSVVLTVATRGFSGKVLDEFGQPVSGVILTVLDPPGIGPGLTVASDNSAGWLILHRHEPAVCGQAPGLSGEARLRNSTARMRVE